MQLAAVAYLACDEEDAEELKVLCNARVFGCEHW